MRLVTVSFFALLLSLTARPLVRAAGAPFVIEPQAMRVVERFEAAWRAAHSISFRDVKVERLRDGRVVTEELAVKYQRPGRVYLRMLRPRLGQEVIYDPRRDPKRLTVHPGRFPDLTLSLDIEGRLAMLDQHHTVAAVGFDVAAHILRSAIERARREPYGDRLAYAGRTTFDGRQVDRVVMHAGHHPGRRVVAREDETLLAFARRVDLDPYVIYAANSEIRSLSSRLEGGQAYSVPAYYAQLSESWFDRATGMPLKQVMWNADGSVYESYSHLDLILNPPFSEVDFDLGNPAYDF